MKHITIAAILLAATIVPPVVSTAATGQIVSDLDNPKITFEYGRPENSFFRPIYLRMTQRKVLEQLKQFLAPLQLPAELRRPLLLRTKECKPSEPAGELNAWYSPGEVSITFCYQFIDQFERYAPTVRTDEGLTPEDAVDGQFVGVMIHELGHALSDLLHLPVFGREEDVADQIAAFVLMQFGPEVARRTILAQAHYWRESHSVDPRNLLSDVHATDLQRHYNFLCLGYGGYPEYFKDIREKNLLPEHRARNCVREYEQVRFAFEQTIKVHLDMELVKKVQSIDWLPKKP